MTATEIRANYSRLFKLMRLANKNANQDEASAALRQADRIVARLDRVWKKRAHLERESGSNG
jgi:hypothetical protein